MIAWRLGWRNLWRNSRRSFITIASIASAFTFLIALCGLMEGLKRQLLSNGTDLLTGHVQIHDAAYLPDRNLYDTLGGEGGTDWPELLSWLAQQKQVLAATPRVYAFGLLSTGDRSVGAEILGVDPQRERMVTTLLQDLASGNLDLDAGSRSIVLGVLLARELQARSGSEVAIVAQAADGTLANDLYRVTGILRTGLTHYDRSLALLHRSDLQEFLVLDDRIHELVIRSENPLLAGGLARRLGPQDQFRGMSVQSWEDLSPQLKEYLGLTEGMAVFTISLVALFAALGVLNTMLMAVFERTREIGLLNSLGMAPYQIVLSILVESLFLGFMGLASGMVSGGLLMSYLSIHGWDLSRWTGELSMLNSRIDPVLRAVWDWKLVFFSALGLAIAFLVATLFPAWRAARLSPVKALAGPGA